MKVTELSHFFFQISKFCGCAPYSIKTYETSFSDLLYSLLIIFFLLFLLILRILKDDEVEERGSSVSKLSMILIYGFSISYYALTVLGNSVNRNIFRKLMKNLAWIEKKVSFL